MTSQPFTTCVGASTGSPLGYGSATTVGRSRTRPDAERQRRSRRSGGRGAPPSGICTRGHPRVRLHKRTHGCAHCTDRHRRRQAERFAAELRLPSGRARSARASSASGDDTRGQAPIAWPTSGPNVSGMASGAIRVDPRQTAARPATIRDRTTSHDSTPLRWRALRRQRSHVRIIPGASSPIPPALKGR